MSRREFYISGSLGSVNSGQRYFSWGLAMARLLAVGAHMRIEKTVFTFRHTGFRLALTRVRANAPIQLCSRVRGGSGFFGGRSVARILVADDNSNIQKMVSLALKDQGIDVVAVGNGEAAVRKISDLRPDLVLAD